MPDSEGRFQSREDFIAFVKELCARPRYRSRKMVDTCAGEFLSKTPYFYLGGMNEESDNLED